MYLRIFCKAVVTLSFVGLLCIVLIPCIRESKSAPGIAALLLIGVALNLYCSKRLERKPLGFLMRRKPVRTLIVLVLFAPLGGFIFTSLADAYERQLPVFHEAMNVTEASQAAATGLGLPIKVGWPIRGDYSGNDQSGRWVLRIPVSGHDRRGTILAIGTRTEGQWRLAELILTVNDSTIRQSIPLAGGRVAHPNPE